MVDINKLERLQELRQRGALNDEEFQSQKERLLMDKASHPTKFKIMLAIFGGVAILIAALLGYLAAKNNPDSRNVVLNSKDPVPRVQASASVAQGSPAIAVTDTGPSKAGYQWAMDSSVIGLNPAFVESKLGTAKEKSAEHLLFEIEGCEVSYGVNGNRIVSAYSAVNAHCQPVIEGRRITRSSTFGLVAGAFSKLISDCIYMCGNAADPTINLYTAGYHANGFIDVVYHGGYGDVSGKAMDRWAEAIRLQHSVKEDDWDNTDFAWFTCVDNAPGEVARMMRTEQIVGVAIGREMGIC